MKGFFTSKQTESQSRPDGKILSCASCGGYKNCKTPKMQPIGNFQKKILIIGSAPERADDRQGQGFQSPNADFLKKTLALYDVDMFEDCLLTYASHCYNPERECEPSNYEIECCRKTTIQIVREHKPRLIILLGDAAVFSLIGNRWKKDLNDIDKWRGWCIPDQDFRAWLCPTFDIYQVKDRLEVQTVWKLDLEKALGCLNIEFPVYKEPQIVYLENDLSVLSTIKGEIAFDYETTGLKPHAEGHKIICCSVAVSSNLVYVFMMPKRKKDRKPFLDLLTNNKIGKVAQNYKFEHNWTYGILGVEVQNWIWDTMLATHVLDNRPGVTGLKFQVYTNFGIVTYDGMVSSYLKAKEEKNANSINNIEELIKTENGKKELLKYCALDSIFTFRLSLKQRKLMEPELPF